MDIIVSRNDAAVTVTMSAMQFSAVMMAVGYAAAASARSPDQDLAQEFCLLARELRMATSEKS